MLDAQTSHPITELPAPRREDRRRIERDDRGPFPLAVEFWRAPLHLGFAFGLFMATRALGVR